MRNLEAATAPEGAADAQERTLVLWVTNFSHALNHFQNQMVTVLYPVIMAELGFGYAQLGVLTAARTLVGHGAQGVYGFLTPFARRTVLLALGNVMLGAGTFLSGVAGSFAGFVGARTFAALGTSAQHPVGSSLLAGYFPTRRGAILALNTSVANVGSLLAPTLAATLLLIIGWRQIFLLVAFASVAMGVAYFFLRDRVGGRPAMTSGRARLAASGASYLRVLRNRNVVVVSVVMMAGAAGRGEGVNVAYLGPHLVNDLGLAIAVAGLVLSTLQLGNIAGPVVFGWLSDRLSRTAVIQSSLVLSALATLWIANQGPVLPALFLSAGVYGAVTGSRNPLTQALVADSLADVDRDAGFSVYYFVGFISAPAWALLTGVLMEVAGFAFAFSVLAASYVAGAALLTFAESPATTSAPPDDSSTYTTES